MGGILLVVLGLLFWLSPQHRADPERTFSQESRPDVGTELLERPAKLEVKERTPVARVREWYGLTGTRKLCEQAEGEGCARQGCPTCYLVPGKRYDLFTVMLRSSDSGQP